MSQRLAGLIEQEMRSAFGQDIKDPDKLASAIARAVQQYLNSNVIVAPGQTVTTRGTAAAQTGTTTTNGRLIAQ